MDEENTINWFAGSPGDEAINVCSQIDCDFNAIFTDAPLHTDSIPDCDLFGSEDDSIQHPLLPTGHEAGHEAPTANGAAQLEWAHSQGDYTHSGALQSQGDIRSKYTTKPQHRSLPRRRSKYLLRKSRSGTNPIAIPIFDQKHGRTDLLPMQRWRDSPPEDEGASLSAINNVLSSGSRSDLPALSGVPKRNTWRIRDRPASVTSRESGASSSSIQSGNSSCPSVSSQNSQLRRGRRSARATRKNTNSANRIFKCTFCCDTFKHKHDWSRHEKSLHLNMEEWRCTPDGGLVSCPVSDQTRCAYCNAHNPSPEHLEQHRHSECQDGPAASRTFRRKDHLVQHLRLFHCLEELPFIGSWKVEESLITCRCGFCDAMLNSWKERIDHLAIHFREGKTMADWYGDHGFDDSIAARVTNSMAPYLIASETMSLIPYSATNPMSKDLFNQISSQIDRLATKTPPPTLTKRIPKLNSIQIGHTENMSVDVDVFSQREVDTIVFTDVLTRHLSRFARQQMSVGVVPTDEMFQRESRRVLYDGDEDDWNQTVADHPEWLEAFKKQYGLEMQAER